MTTTPLPPMRDEFLSEEDLDFRNLTTEERAAHWHLWFLQAQATNDNDLWTYAHGVFEEVPECARVSPARAVTGPAVRRP